MTKIATEFNAVVAEIMVHRPTDIENNILTISFVSLAEDNHQLLGVMNALSSLKNRASIEIYAEEIEEE